MNKPHRKKEPPKIHVCSKCGSAFNRPYRLRQHEKIHENIKQFVCGELNCNKSYTNKSHLDRHIFSVHQQPELNVIYSCPQCMKVYVNRQNLKRHINTYHGRKSGFTCDVCNKLFQKKHLLSGHMYQHTFVKSFSCDFCSSEFITLMEKKKHMKHHKTYSCDLCEMAFVQWSKYLKHKETHNDYHCDDCGRRFNKRVHIVRHMKVHSKHPTQKFYQCTYENCDKAYARNSNLKHHIKMKHLKAKHECEICPAKLSSKANLLTHLKTHKKAKDNFLQPTKEMGRMLRSDKGTAKTSTALRIAGLVIDPENESIRGTLKNIGDSEEGNADLLSDHDPCDLMDANTATEQKDFADPAMEIEQNVISNSDISRSDQNGIAESKPHQNGVNDSITEQKCFAKPAMEQSANAISYYGQNGVSNSEIEQNSLADSKTEQNGDGDTTEVTSEADTAMDVTVGKIQETLETKTIFHETLKTDFKDQCNKYVNGMFRK